MSLRVGIACCMWHVKSCLVLFMLCCVVCVVHVPRCRCCASYSYVLACVLMCNSLGASFSPILARHVSKVYKDNLQVEPQKSPKPKGTKSSGTRYINLDRYKKVSEGGPVRACGRRRDTQPAVIRAKAASQTLMEVIGQR